MQHYNLIFAFTSLIVVPNFLAEKLKEQTLGWGNLTVKFFNLCSFSHKSEYNVCQVLHTLSQDYTKHQIMYYCHHGMALAKPTILFSYRSGNIWPYTWSERANMAMYGYHYFNVLATYSKQILYLTFVKCEFVATNFYNNQTFYINMN